MPFQRSNTAASVQLLSAPPHQFNSSALPSITSTSTTIATNSALAESSFNALNHPQASIAPARKQHHVSFQDDHPKQPPQNSSNRRGRNQRTSNTNAFSDSNHTSSEHVSSRQLTSRESHRHAHRESNQPESSAKSVAGGSAPSSSSRSRKSRQRSEKRSERSQQQQQQQQQQQSEHAAKTGSQHNTSLSQTRPAPSAKSEPSISPSKRDANSRDTSVSAKRSRQQPAHAILSDLRTQDASRSEAGTRSQHSSSSRMHRFARSHDARSMPGESSTSRDGRQLFDPRRDDPVKFASQQRSQVDGRSTPSAPSPRLTATSTAQPQILMRSTTSNASSASHLVGSPIINPSISDTAFTPAVDPSDPSALQAHVLEIKKIYRSIYSMEATLHEAHHAQVESARLYMADYVPPDLRHPSYWITLIAKHRDLADCHSSFLEITCRPELPRSIQELAEVYNLPSRLWQTAFHLMLESLRNSLSSQHHLQTNERKAQLLDHLTEFIYYAYSFYSALQESEKYKSFRRAWIESLGDLSRYRMAVAGLAANMSIESGGDEIRNTQSDDARPFSPVDARIDDEIEENEDDDDDDYFGQTDDDDVDDRPDQHGGEHAARRHGPKERIKDNADPRSTSRKDRAVANDFDKASIGTAALGDWEWTEKETWRQTAKDWYAMGITESPNIGRLHHHLGVLSRGENDLRALYHLTKSLIAAKPFASARDSILTLFDHERQARRLRRDSSIEELFLYLHGSLITKVQLDDFEPVFDRLMARLTKLVEEQGPACLPQSAWTMMATINIAGLFQYGSVDSRLADLLLQQTGKSAKRPTSTHKAKTSTPTAILVSSAAAKTDDNLLSELPRDAEWDDLSDDESEAGDDVQLISLEPKASANEDQETAEELPLVLDRAATLCFAMQRLTFDLSTDAFFRSNPYTTTISTFLVSLCQSKKAFRLLERFIPWDLWLQYVRNSVSLTERNWPKCLSNSYITAQLLLPEDFCLRGILGLSRHLYDRNLWRNAANDDAIAASQGFDNEVQVLDADDGELYARTESAWRISATRRRDESESPTLLDTVRAYRLAFVARKMARAARGFELDSKTSALSLSKLLLARLARRKMEEEQRQLELRIQQLRLSSLSPTALLSNQGERTDERQDVEDEDDDFDSDWDSDPDAPRHECSRGIHAILSMADSQDVTEEIRALQGRSCHLRNVLHSVDRSLSGQRSIGGKAASAKAKTSVQPNPAAANIVPGYTILVIDTNIIVTPGSLVCRLIESQRWTVIIPLAVITELDGLRRNDNELGREAEKAIQFLESRIRTHSKYVKVQTSRGNYLNDLNCRSEDIDFTWQGITDGATHPEASSPRMDAASLAGETKSVAARNVDEVILRILAWQRDHFVDRRNLLQTSAGSSGQETNSMIGVETLALKSVLLTLDRNLRLKAKSRGLSSLDAKGVASL